MEPLWIMAVGSGFVGAAMAAFGVVALIVSIRDASARLGALGVVFVGIFVVAVSGILFDLALIGDERLSLLAGLLPILLLGLVAIRMRRAASRQFVEARKARRGDLAQR